MAEQSRWTRHKLHIFIFNLIFLTTLGVCDYSPINQFCMRWNQQSTVKNNILYVDGGFQTFSDPGAIGPFPLGYNRQLITVPLSDSWDWKVNISQVGIAKTANPKTGSYPPSLIGGAVFQGNTNDDRIFTYGGSFFQSNSSFGNPPPDPVTYSLWSYARGSNQWDQYDISSASTVRPSEGAYASAPDQGLGFWLGGQVNNGSDSGSTGLGSGVIPVQGLIVVNMTAYVAKARNISAVDLWSGNIGGSLTYLQTVADNGIMIAMGGVKKAPGIITEANGTLATFEYVDVFDIASIYSNGKGAWYKQKTSGTAPAPRSDYCTVVASAPDKSSHNIYLYAGRNPIDGTIYDDVYVLSLPSFIWVKIYQGSSPRFAHTCHLVGKRQMLTTGGNINNTLNGVCDWHTAAVGVMDLSSGIWGSIYNAYAAPYKVAQSIVDLIGGSPDGGSTQTAPIDGFSSNSIENLFAPRISKNSGSGSGSGSGSTTTPSNAKKSNAGVIAGAVIGILAGIGILSGLAFFLWRRKQQAARANDSPPSYGDSEKTAELAGSSEFGTHAELPAKHIAVEQVYELPASESNVELEGDTPSLGPSPASTNSVPIPQS